MTSPQTALPHGHQLIHATKLSTDLTGGDRIHLSGLGAFTIAAAPIALTRSVVCVPLTWERLAVLAAPDAHWDAVSVDPPIRWRHRSCKTCAGTGRS